MGRPITIGVGLAQFGDQGVGEIDDRLLLGAALFGLGQEGHEAGAVQVGHRVGAQVAADDFQPGGGGQAGGNEALGELAGLALGGKQAGVDLEQGGHGGSPCGVSMGVLNDLPER
jgi:hypothetical protein